MSPVRIGICARSARSWGLPIFSKEACGARAGKVRVTAQLIETRTNTHLWAETYDRELADVFAIQSDIAQRIATALQAKLAPEEKARLDARPTANSEAYVLYLTARGTENYARGGENLHASHRA